MEGAGRKKCCVCGRMHPVFVFTPSQLRKKGRRQCKICVRGLKLINHAGWKGARVDFPATIIACLTNDVDVVSYVLQHIDNLQFVNYMFPGICRGCTPLTYASRFGLLEIAKCLVETGLADVDMADETGYTPLNIACLFGHTETVRYLVTEAGAKVDPHTLGTSLFEEHMGIAKMLIKVLVDKDILDTVSLNVILIQSCRRGLLASVRFLVLEANVDVDFHLNVCGYMGYAQLLETRAHRRMLRHVVELLLKREDKLPPESHDFLVANKNKLKTNVCSGCKVWRTFSDPRPPPYKKCGRCLAAYYWYDTFCYLFTHLFPLNFFLFFQNIVHRTVNIVTGKRTNRSARERSSPV